MITRKVQQTGGGTFIISLPKKWAEKRLKKGDTVFISKEENELIIRAKKIRKEREKITISFKKDVESLLKRVIAVYLKGYERIEVRADGKLEKRERIKHKLRKNLAGIEITSETKDCIVIQNLVSYEKIPFETTLSKLHFLIDSMLQELIAYLKEEKEIKDTLKTKEEEVDRFFILGFKQLGAFLRGTKIKTDIKDKEESLHYIMILKSLEKIADHIGILYSHIQEREFSEEERKTLLNLLTESYHSFKESYEPLIRKDFQMGSDKATKTLRKLQEIREDENLPKVAGSMFLLYHIVRILGYSSDIAEMAVDVSIP